MRTHCATCGKKVPKKRQSDERSNYSGFFCSTKCHLAYSDEVIAAARQSEIEVQQDINRELKAGKGPWNDILEDLDEVAAEATATAERPQEIAAHFLGAVAGKLATKIATNFYGKFSDAAKAWTEKRTERQAETAAKNQSKTETKSQQPEPKTGPVPTPPPAAKSPQPGHPAPPKTNDTTPPPQKTGAQQKPPQGPQPQTKWKRIPEPPDLDELPLEEQREWYLRRFYLPETATIEDVRAKWRVLSRKYHPDNRATGNPKLMSLINASKQRLEELEEELAPRQSKKRKR